MYNQEALKEIEAATRTLKAPEELEATINAIVIKYAGSIEVVETLSNGIQKLRAVDKDGLIIGEWHSALLLVNGAWYVDNLPTMLVIELPDNTFAMFDMQRFRPVTRAELKQYRGHHPRKLKGQPLPDYLYRFYGLEKNDETLSEVVRVRLSPSEKERLDNAAKQEDKTTSEFIRSWVRSL